MKLLKYANLKFSSTQVEMLIVFLVILHCDICIILTIVAMFVYLSLHDLEYLWLPHAGFPHQAHYNMPQTPVPTITNTNKKRQTVRHFLKMSDMLFPSHLALCFSLSSVFFQSVLPSLFPSNVTLLHLFLQFPQPPHDVRHISNTASSYLWNGGCKNISVSWIVCHIYSNDTV